MNVSICRGAREYYSHWFIQSKINIPNPQMNRYINIIGVPNRRMLKLLCWLSWAPLGGAFPKPAKLLETPTPSPKYDLRARISLFLCKIIHPRIHRPYPTPSQLWPWCVCNGTAHAAVPQVGSTATCCATLRTVRWNFSPFTDPFRLQNPGERWPTLW